MIGMTGQPDVQRQGSLLVVALYRRFAASSEGKRALTRLLNAIVRDACWLGLLTVAHCQLVSCLGTCAVPRLQHEGKAALFLQTRGAATGFCLRGGLHLTSLLFSLLNAARRRRKARLQSLREMLKESLRYTAFLGSFAGLYVAVDEGIAALFGKQRCACAALPT